MSILKCPYCSDSIRKSGAYIVGMAHENTYLKLDQSGMKSQAPIQQISKFLSILAHLITFKHAIVSPRKWVCFFQMKENWHHLPEVGGATKYLKPLCATPLRATPLRATPLHWLVVAATTTSPTFLNRETATTHYSTTATMPLTQSRAAS